MSGRASLALLCLVLLARSAGAFYSISYSAEGADKRVANAGGSFVSAPSAEHVADVYARLSGRAPLFKSDSAHLPTLGVLSDSREPPLLLEVTGGKLPSDVMQVVRAAAFEGELGGPSLDSVLRVLGEHGIQAASKKMEAHGELSASVADFIRGQQGRPVVILHHETPSSYHYIRRDLLTTSVPALTEFQISQYQICLWTGVMMVLLISSAVCGMYRMEVIPDSLLFAKFVSTKTNKHE